MKFWPISLLFLFVVGCKKEAGPPLEEVLPAETVQKQRAPGKVYLTVSVDWEGAFLSEAGMSAMDGLRDAFKGIKFTHFICPAYYTKDGASKAKITRELKFGIEDADEVALHIHGWKTLAEHADVTPRLTPSFRSADDELMKFDDDVGYDIDLRSYGAKDFERLLRSSRDLLEDAEIEVVPIFRAGGGLLDQDNFEALVAAGFVADASSIDWRDWQGRAQAFQVQALKKAWPKREGGASPHWIETKRGPLLEMTGPFAILADYATPEEIESRLRQAIKKAASSGADVWADVAFHQETAEQFSPRVSKALHAVLGEQGEALRFSTFSDALALAKGIAGPPPSLPQEEKTQK